MAARRSARKTMEKPTDVIELSSDSEPEGPEFEEAEDQETIPVAAGPDVDDQPLLRAAGIKYKTDISDLEDKKPQQDEHLSPASAKLTVRVKDTGSVKHRHVSIEIPLPTSSELQRRKAEATDSHDGNDEEVFKTPNERKHITFDDSDHDEFVTPREGPLSNPLDASIATPNTAKETEAEEEESDDDAPPEAVSTRAAESYNLKAAEVAEKAAKQQAAALKRKRQERDTFFKQQAEERKRTQKPASPEEDSDDASPITQEPKPQRAEKHRREVPKLLPLELLESDDEDDVVQQSSSAANGNNKRRKLGSEEQRLLAEPKLPRDKRVGSTAYRVVKGQGNTRLAPKVKKQAINLKEALLRRDRVPQPKGGFFVNRH